MLEDYVLERLSPAQAQRVKSHLSQCQDCRREVDELKMFGDAIHQYCQGQAEEPSMLWRERLRNGQLPSQTVKRAPQERPDSILRRLQQLMLPLVARPVPLLVSFLMGMLALPAAHRMGAGVPLFFSGVPVVSVSQTVPIKAQQRSVPASQVVVHPGIGSITFQMSVEESENPIGQARMFRCRLHYQERLVADPLVPVIDGAISIAVHAASLPAGRYRLEWFENPQGRTMHSDFVLLQEGATGSPPEVENIR